MKNKLFYLLSAAVCFLFVTGCTEPKYVTYVNPTVSEDEVPAGNETISQTVTTVKFYTQVSPAVNSDYKLAKTVSGDYAAGTSAETLCGLYTKDGFAVSSYYIEGSEAKIYLDRVNITYKFYVDDEVYAEITGKFEAAVTKPSNPSKEGLYFMGWKDSKGNTATISSTFNKDSQSYYAIFTEIKPKFYTAAVGDFILSDGSFISPSSYTAGMNVIAIIFDIDEYKNGARALGINLNTNNVLEWSKSSVALTSGSFSEIAITVSESYFTLGSTTYSGNYNDGAENWNYILSADPTYSADPATYYPVFNYAMKYGETFNLPENFKNGWYLPAFDELVTIYSHLSTISSSLSSLGISAFDNNHWFWSSNTSADDNDSVMELNMSARMDCIISKTWVLSNQMSICSVRHFY